jgi:oligoendopeptidase F
MHEAQAFFQQLNRDYLKVHRVKEDLFWATYMGTSTDHAGFARAEQAFKEFISDPQLLSRVKAHLSRLEAAPDAADNRALRHGLEGWQRLFECNIIDNDDARSRLRELIEMEAALFSQRQQYTMFHLNEQGQREEATLGSLSTNLGTNPDEGARKSSHDAFLDLEHWVLEHGFLDIVSKRNQLAQALGFPDYFEYKVRKNEQMSSDQLFAILDEFEARTRNALRTCLARLVQGKGAEALQAHNLVYHMKGDVTRKMDPFFPFAKSVERWIQSFRRLGITFRGATLQLDLLDRKGKHQNGFCHGPVPCYFDEQGRWVPAQVNFTSDGRPAQVGSGVRALNTLFHEGGHAAHFANITQNSPCFSQEFPPTSMAYAETQSMFCDSLLEDADWLKRYAKDLHGEPIPDGLIRAQIEANQPFRTLSERSILVVPYFERELYRMPEKARTPAAVLALARECEHRILGVDISPRPLLVIPHLLNQESAAAYHGYLLAHMAVYQTRAYFLNKFGYLTDNPAIGPLLAEHYWSPGNSVSHDQTLINLTGEGFTPRYLADLCNQSVEEAWAEAQWAMAASAARAYPQTYPDDLDAQIRLVHGSELIADNAPSDALMIQRFEAWTIERFGTAATS